MITSRNQLTSLIAIDGAHPLTLDLLSPDEAPSLLSRRLSPARMAAEPEAVQDIITFCARLPLALTIAAARAAIRPTFPLADLAAEPARLLDPHRDSILLALAPPVAGVAPECPSDDVAAMGWFTAEHAVLLAAVRAAGSGELDTRTWQLAWALTTFLDRQGYWHELAACWRAALDAAARLADLPAQAFAHYRLAWADTRRGRHEEAHSHLDRSLALYSRTGDRDGRARVHHCRGYLWERQGRPDRALHASQQALSTHLLPGRRPRPRAGPGAQRGRLVPRPAR